MGEHQAGYQRGFEFDTMARRPMYTVCREWLLRHCDIRPGSTVVDLGCGSGIFTEMLLDRFRDDPALRIIAIDPSEHELTIMRSRVKDPRVSFFQGRAQDAAGSVRGADAVIMAGVLHLIPIEERAPVVKAVFDMLRPGGAIGAHTMFYDGGIWEDSRAFYTSWIMHARAFLKQRSIAIAPPTRTPTALQRMNPGQHADLLGGAGFTSVVVEEVDTSWEAEDWEALSHYSEFIRGAVGESIDLGLGRDALVAGARAAYQDLGLTHVRRGWLHCAGRRP